MLRLNADHLDWNEVGDEIVVLDVETSECFSLNSTAAEMWRQLAAGTTAEALTVHLQSVFDVDADTAANDVTGFVNLLRDSKLLNEQAP